MLHPVYLYAEIVFGRISMADVFQRCEAIFNSMRCRATGPRRQCVVTERIAMT